MALALVASGRGWLVAVAAGQTPDIVGPAWVQLVAMVSFLPWGLALGVATGAYWLRRRGGCDACARGLAETIREAAPAGGRG